MKYRATGKATIEFDVYVTIQGFDDLERVAEERLQDRLTLRAQYASKDYVTNVELDELTDWEHLDD